MFNVLRSANDGEEGGLDERNGDEHGGDDTAQSVRQSAVRQSIWFAADQSGGAEPVRGRSRGETTSDWILGANFVEDGNSQRATNQAGENDADGGNAHHFGVAEERRHRNGERHGDGSRHERGG